MSNPFAELDSYSLGSDNSIPSEAIASLNTDGVVCLRNVFGPHWLATLERGIESALNGASTDLDIVKRDTDKGSFSFSSGAWAQVEEFRKIIFESHFADIGWSLLQSRHLTLFYDFLLIKQPFSSSAATPWHQDHSYYPLDGVDVINCWVALDDIPYESALRFQKGSHLEGQLYRAVDFENPNNAYRHAREHLPLIPGESEQGTILTTELKAGDMLAWKSYTVHSAPGNSLDQRRAAFSVNWLGDDVVFNGAASLETYRHESQVIGQRIACDKFPIVRE